MTTSDNIPRNNGGLFFEPDLRSWPEAVARNRERFAEGSFWGLSPKQVRAELKLPVDRPVILSGHQPVFFHPGLWIKCLAASRLAEAVQGAAYHKLTDTAMALEHPHYMPEIEENGKARRKPIEFFHSEDLRTQEKSLPYAFLAAPEHDALRKIFADAQVHCPPAVKLNVRSFEDKMFQALRSEPTWNGFHVSMLRLLDELSGTRRKYMAASKLWASESFNRFLSHWLTHLPELTEHYNLSLEEYRAKHGIKNKVAPSPNLKFEDWWFEIPFWAVNKYRHRHSLWAKRDGKNFLLRGKATEAVYTVPMDDFQKELGLLPLEIWPKAMPQTLFSRLYLCDFFVHGTGGSTYEEVNDIFFKRVFNAEPPAFGVATATYFADPEQVRGVEKILEHEPKVQGWERALAKNPEYLFTRETAWRAELPVFMHKAFEKCLGDPVLQKLAGVKQRALEEMKDPSLRVEASKKVKETNFALYDLYTEVIRVLEQGILDADRVRELYDVLKFREYPFFCYSPGVFPDMVENIRASSQKS